MFRVMGVSWALSGCEGEKAMRVGTGKTDVDDLPCEGILFLRNEKGTCKST